MLVATGAAGDGTKTYTPLNADGSTVVLPTTDIRLVFDRFLLPALTPIRQSLCLRPILDEVKTFNDCSNGVFLEPAYDPVRREVDYRQRVGDTGLAPGTTYKLTVLAPPDETSSGFRAFDGAPLDANVTFEMKVATSAMGTTIDGAPTSETWCSDGACVARCKSTCKGEPGCVATCSLDCGGVQTFFQTCARACCHAPGLVCQVNGPVLPVAEGLDLATLESFKQTAMGRVAHETQEGEHASIGDETPLRFGRAMPIFDPGNAGNSYALYKTLINPANAYQDGAAPSPEEIARLRASVVVGLAMPALRPPYFHDQPTTTFSTQQQLDNLSLWLQQGAPTKACP